MTPQRWQAVAELFHAALGQPPSRVDDFLREECGSDTALYAEVRDMVREHLHSGWLDRPIVEFFEDGKPVFAEGQLVSGRYRILRFVARGGMGEVYEAEDRELNERVALKTLLPSIAGDAHMIARFKQEIQLSRKIAHPNVCRVFDLARDPADGSGAPPRPGSVFFLTMEFLDGETLGARLQREERLAPPAALPVVEQMSQGLDAAHQAGVIHRDLKPSNVMLVPRAVITDFGLARNLPRSSDTTVTLSAGLAGTLDYMAPELLTSHRATVASDIYALGMVAYKMVTGRLPFAGDPPLTAAILRSRVPVPAPRSLVPDLDPAWDRAILRALDPDPARRFSTAGAFARALRGEAHSMTLPLPAMTRRRLVGGGILAAGLAAGGFSWWAVIRARAAPPAGAVNFYHLGVDDIHAGAYFAATKALGQAVRLAPHFSLAHARLAEAWNELDLTERAGQEMLLARREDVSRLPPLDRLQLEAIDLTITREFDSAAGKYEQMRRYLKPDDAGFNLDLGRAYEKSGQPLKAMESYRRATKGPSQSSAAWLRLAVLYARASDATQAEQAFQQAETLYQLTSNLEGLTEVAQQRGIAANVRGQLPEAAAYLTKALETARLAGNLQQEINAKLRLSTNAYLSGDDKLTERYAREALDTARSYQMEALAIRGIINLGNSCSRKPDWSEAEKYYQEALQLARRSSSSHSVAIALASLASVHDQLKQSEDAVREAREALSFYQPNRYVKESLQCLTIMGRAERNRGNYSAALDSFRRLLKLAEQVNDRSQIALAHESIGNVLFAQERYPIALEEFRSSLGFSTDAEHIGYAGLACGYTLWLLGRYSEARAALDKADAAAGKFALLRVSLTQTRAEMLLSQGSYAEAARIARGALASYSGLDSVMSAELKRVLGLALVGTGNRSQGLRNCEESLAAVAKLEDVTAPLRSRMALLQARLETGDRAGAHLVFQGLEPALVGHPESRWHALALLALSDRQYAQRARSALEELRSLWGEDAFRTYLQRPNIQKLSRPLFASNFAK